MPADASDAASEIALNLHVVRRWLSERGLAATVKLLSGAGAKVQLHEDKSVTFTVSFSRSRWYDYRIDLARRETAHIAAQGRGDDYGVFILALLDEAKARVAVKTRPRTAPAPGAAAIVEALLQRPDFAPLPPDPAPHLAPPAAGPAASRSRLAGVATAARVAALAPLALVWYVAGPITYVLAVVDTWHSHASVPVKLLLNLTLDAIAGTIWPVTWVIWTIEYAASGSGPLAILLH